MAIHSQAPVEDAIGMGATTPEKSALGKTMPVIAVEDNTRRRPWIERGFGLWDIKGVEEALLALTMLIAGGHSAPEASSTIDPS